MIIGKLFKIIFYPILVIAIAVVTGIAVTCTFLFMPNDIIDALDELFDDD